MKMIPDKTGRFSMRPYWDVAELERMCEETITGLLRQRYGFDRVPVPTEAITLLIERDAAELDVATDLSDEVYDGFGVTLFYDGRKPTVKIARELWEQVQPQQPPAHDARPRVRPRYAPHLAVREVRDLEGTAALLLEEPPSSSPRG